MTAHVKVSGSYKEITGIHTRVSGTWKEITEGHVKVSGVWKQFYANAALAHTLTITPGTSPAAPTTATFYAEITTEGYSSEAYIYSFYNASFGAIDDATYDDGSATERTIDALFSAYFTNSGSPIGTMFVLNGNSVPNTNETFHSLINSGSGQVMLRADATYSTGDGNSYWGWGEFFDDPGSNNTFQVYTS